MERTHIVSVRLNDEELRRLDEKCAELGISRSEALRSPAVSLERQILIRAELAKLRREISAVGNNINQIARSNNAGYFTPSDFKTLSRISDELADCYRKILARLGEIS